MRVELRYKKNSMIYIIKEEGLYQDKVNFSRVEKAGRQTANTGKAMWSDPLFRATLSLTPIRPTSWLASQYDLIFAASIHLHRQQSFVRYRKWSPKWSANDLLNIRGMEWILGMDGEWCGELEQRVKHWNETDDK